MSLCRIAFTILLLILMSREFLDLNDLFEPTVRSESGLLSTGQKLLDSDSDDLKPPAGDAETFVTPYNFDNHTYCD